MERVINMTEKLVFYTAPEASVVPADASAILCESPKPGGNESLIYEEW